MHLYPVKRGAAVRRFLPLLVILAAAALLFYGLGLLSRTSEQEQKAAVERAIQNPWSTATPSRGPIPRTSPILRSITA